MLLSSAGCAGLQDTEYSVATWARAEKAWLQRTSFSQRWEISDHYEKGWKDGYKAAARGEACRVPHSPPPCYWSYRYQCCEGREAISQWYQGWHAGATAAAGDGRASFHEIPAGPCVPSVAAPGCNNCGICCTNNGVSGTYNLSASFDAVQNMPMLQSTQSSPTVNNSVPDALVPTPQSPSDKKSSEKSELDRKPVDAPDKRREEIQSPSPQAFQPNIIPTGEFPLGLIGPTGSTENSFENDVISVRPTAYAADPIYIDSWQR